MSYKNRQEFNRQILGKIAMQIEECPEERFTQILFNMGINEFQEVGVSLKDKYNEESETTFNNIK